ncbi:MFS general substrate transporter [Ephemerocybe angulata]|uniref:MFS general substrate transporter n=1 Tax=Ephemerocybe angulata TaxID=980116 RepID=A0A8H6IBT4_9AGAR|nr:MFS general substrate transporter [Tulosesus angulatus]
MSSNDPNDIEDAYARGMTKRILWKLDSNILPPLALVSTSRCPLFSDMKVVSKLWLANFIDRSNIGNARIAGLEKDTHLVGNQFNVLLTLFYVTYVLVEVPSNIVLKKMQPNRWIPLLVFLWGIVTVLTCVVKDFKDLVIIRLFLGICEGGLLPGLILYLSTLYKKHELQLRVGIFYASASLSGAFGGLLASVILKMDGLANVPGWKWIFILEGMATVVIAGIAFLILPKDLASAKFLTPEERTFAVERFRRGNINLVVSRAGTVREDNLPGSGNAFDAEKSESVSVREATAIDPLAVEEEEQFEWREVWRGITDIQTWLTGIAYFGLVVGLYSYSLFLPTIIAGLGYSGIQAQLRTVPPYVPAAVMTGLFFFGSEPETYLIYTRTVVVAIYSDRLKWRGPFILMCLPFSIIGYIIAITATTNKARYVAVFFMSVGVYPSAPCILSILPNNSSGHYKKATTTALQLAIANTGGFVATFAYTPDQRPKYIRGHTISLAFVSLAWFLVACNVAYCMWENKARREGRRQSNITKYEHLKATGKTRAPIGDRHPDFILTL